IAPAMWRMDQHFERFRDQVPHLKRRPSEYVREHFWFTTQPIDEPDEARHLRSLIEWVGVGPSAVLAGLSALGFGRPGFRLQDAAERSRTDQDLQRQRPRALQALVPPI